MFKTETIQNNAAYKQPWIGKSWIDILFILLPPFGSLLFIMACPHLFQNNNNIPDAWWVIMVLLIDVAHVYSTLYRTYFDRTALPEQRGLLWIIPFLSFIASVLVYSLSGALFWRILAYVAVFHFVRQQYGFMRIYSRSEASGKWFKRIDTFVIYYATIYPLIYWHLTSPKNFNWFTDNDFVYFQSPMLLQASTWLYYAMLMVYVVKEIVLLIKTNHFNIPRIAIIIGTIASWYFGIVYYNGDMAFTLLNVVSHGIPYMALVWIFGEKQVKRSPQSSSVFLKKVFTTYGIAIFLGIIFLLAFVEEGLWDMTVWKEHVNIFSIFHFGDVELNDRILSFVVPLLALPQITHYVIDGFIWKSKNNKVVVK